MRETTMHHIVARRASGNTQLVLHGPFPIPHHAHPDFARIKSIRKSDAAVFWNSRDVNELAHKQGCYLFCIQANGTYTPHYVGKTTNCFELETFTDNKLRQYNEALFDATHGHPVMFFVAKDGNRSVLNRKICSDVERFLIQAAYIKHPDLLKNKQQTKLPVWSIKGVTTVHHGPETAVERAFKSMLGLE